MFVLYMPQSKTQCKTSKNSSKMLPYDIEFQASQHFIYKT